MALELHSANSFHSEPSVLDIVYPNQNRELVLDSEHCDYQDPWPPSMGDRLAGDNDERVHCITVVRSAARTREFLAT